MLHVEIRQVQSKAEVLVCLSNAVQTDLMEERPQRVSANCRAELKFELLQKHADIKLDPKLVNEICQNGIEVASCKD